MRRGETPDLFSKKRLESLREGVVKPLSAISFPQIVDLAVLKLPFSGEMLAILRRVIL